MATLKNISSEASCKKSNVSTQRKISLPWFRQASLGEKLTKLRLQRQTTVDVSSSTSAPSSASISNINEDNKLKTDHKSYNASATSLESSELTLVTSDNVAESGSGQLTVKLGQQLEVLDKFNLDKTMVMVRTTTDKPEIGYIPVTCLNDPDHDICGGKVSPVTKRRVFSGKWLPSIRKLSQGKQAEKSQRGEGNHSKQFQKQISKQKIKVGQSSLDVDMGNKQSASSSTEQPNVPMQVDPTSKLHLSEKKYEDVDAGELIEVPPPMMPISSIHDSKASTKASILGETFKDEAVSSQTICDEKITTSCGSESVDDDLVPKALEQRSYRLQEILESERLYVSDLEQVLTYITYMRESKETEDANIPMPEELKQGRDRMIFGNIESIYEWHRDYFLKNLEKCVENPEDLGHLFKKSEKKFQMYVVYCQNKPKSEFIVSAHIDTYFEEIRLKYGFKLRLTDLLIKPIQRLTKYHMLLEAILKHSQRAGMMQEAAAIEQAFHVMTVVPNQANDMMDIGRLQGFEGKIVAQGKLLLHGPLLCTDDCSGGQNYKLREMTVFLFEQIIIFADTVGKKTQFTSPVYTYRAHIQVNKMQFEEKVDGDLENRMFRVKSTCPKGPAITYFCQADNTNSRNLWTSTMSKQLQTQKEFLQALQAPIAYHNKRSK